MASDIGGPEGGIRRATREQKQRLAALIHLCGSAEGERHARLGLELASRLRCGDHSAHAYIMRVEGMRGVFTALAVHGP